MTDSPPLLDWNRLHEISAGDPQLAQDIVNMFLETTQPLLAQLADSIHSQDWPQVARLSHGIRGSSSNIGGDPLAEVAWRLETLAKGEKPNEATMQALALLDNLEEMVIGIRKSEAVKEGER